MSIQTVTYRDDDKKTKNLTLNLANEKIYKYICIYLYICKRILLLNIMILDKNI